MRVLAIQNCDTEGFGLYADRLHAVGVHVTRVMAHRDEALPPPDEYAAIMIGGTPTSLAWADQPDFLHRERRYLARAMARGRACLGICAGA